MYLCERYIAMLLQVHCSSAMSRLLDFYDPEPSVSIVLVFKIIRNILSAKKLKYVFQPCFTNREYSLGK